MQFSWRINFGAWWMCTLIASGCGRGGFEIPATQQELVQGDSAPICGDGVVAGNEVCDDGNLAGADGCSPTCRVEAGWSCSGVTSSCVAPQWGWMGGSSDIGAPGVYGAIGVESATAIPGARSNGATWVHSGTLLWLFAGSRFSDVWRYNTTTGRWAFMGGPTTENQTGVYNSKGSLSATAWPGGRTNTAQFQDSTNRFWLFGGFGFGTSGADSYLSDLWYFDPASSRWAWMGGPNTTNASGTYAGPTPEPGARENAGMCGMGTQGWLFGGRGFDSAGGLGPLSDLWRLDANTATWTFVGGATVHSVGGSLGQKGVEDAANWPGARVYPALLCDRSGRLWLFGGGGYDGVGGNGVLDDVWSYNLANGRWTWISGSGRVDAPTIYGTLGVPSATGQPGGRFSHMAWLDASGFLWTMAGGDATGAAHNDIWRYEVPTGLWTWMGGTNAADAFGVYGTPSSPSPSNFPGARSRGDWWVDGTGAVWLFGGDGGFGASTGPGNLNDLWRWRAP